MKTSAPTAASPPTATRRPTPSCPNQINRYGPGADLPDCRAYEMVSPVAKNGGDILTATAGSGEARRAYNQSSLDGNRMTFSSGASFAGNLGSRVINQYIADRTGSGWETAGIDAPHGKTVYGGGDFNGFETEMNAFKLFTPDLTTSWFINTNAPPLTPDASEGVATSTGATAPANTRR